jgi:hypothetical protein
LRSGSFQLAKTFRRIVFAKERVIRTLANNAFRNRLSCIKKVRIRSPQLPREYTYADEQRTPLERLTISAIAAPQLRVSAAFERMHAS